MSGSADDAVDSGHLDLVPMIDCIMLLLLFFMMTTKFSSEEKAISSLLPTNKGGQSNGGKVLDPPQIINIVLYPDGMGKGNQPKDYGAQLVAMNTPLIQSALLRIGGREPMAIKGQVLKRKKDVVMEGELNAIHQYVKEQLQVFEKAGEPRNKQNDIVIHCFSGLSWKYALVAYDAVRAYEGEKNNMKWTGDPTELDNARSVTFSPPRVRDYAVNELGIELYEIIHMK